MGSDIPIVPGHTSQLALWDVDPTNVGVTKIEVQDYRPVSQITPTSSIEFFIAGTGSRYFDLSKTKLKVSLKIVRPDGGPLSADDHVGPVNLLHSSVFSNIEVTLQQKPIVNLNPPLYAMKAYVDTLLNTSQSVKTSTLQSRLWRLDSAGYMDWASKEGDTGRPNVGLQERSYTLAESKEITLIGPVYSDFFLSQNRYLLNNVPINIKLTQSPDAFRLMSGTEGMNYKLMITDCVIQMCEITVNPDVILAHNKALSVSPAHYCYMNSDFKVFSIAKNQYSFTVDNIYLGDVPSKMYVFLVPSEAYNGHYGRNPFNFINGAVNNISFTVDGQNVPFITPFKPNFETGDFFESYLALMGSCNKHPKESNGITSHEFANGFCIHAFDVDCQNLEGENYFPSSREGHTRLNIVFSEPLPESVNLVVYGKFPKIVKIDSARGVIF